MLSPGAARVVVVVEDRLGRQGGMPAEGQEDAKVGEAAVGDGLEVAVEGGGNAGAGVVVHVDPEGEADVVVVEGVNVVTEVVAAVRDLVEEVADDRNQRNASDLNWKIPMSLPKTRNLDLQGRGHLCPLREENILTPRIMKGEMSHDLILPQILLKEKKIPRNENPVNFKPLYGKTIM